jgi:hypothetical protein
MSKSESEIRSGAEYEADMSSSICRLGYHLHLCSLSTGDKHPLSQTDGVIRLSLDREMQWWYWYDFAHSSRIRGDYLVFLVNSGRSLLLWNWHSGTLVDMVCILCFIGQGRPLCLTL